MLLAGFLGVILTPTKAWSQHTAGSLYFVNRATGSDALGYFDRYGDFHQTSSHPGTQPVFQGITHLGQTRNGIFAYNASNGVGTVVLIKDDGTATYNTYGFSTWTSIVGVGDYLFFYSDNGSGAVGQITADGAFTSGRSYAAGAFPHYTHIVATDNNLFFYNSADGSAATAYLDRGAFVYTQVLPPGSLPTGFSYIVGNGNFLLLYNQISGSTMIGVIDGRPGVFLSRATASLPAGYSKLVRHDRYVLFYDPNTGGGTIGYVDRVSAAKFVVTQKPSFSPNWTRIVSTNDDLLFYNTVTGAGAAGQIDAAGKFHQTPQSLSFSPGWFGVAATTR